MFQNVDRFPSNMYCKHLKVGDMVREIGYCQHKPVRMMVIAFPGRREDRHCVYVRRFDNGRIVKVSQFWIAQAAYENVENWS